MRSTVDTLFNKMASLLVLEKGTDPKLNPLTDSMHCSVVPLQILACEQNCFLVHASSWRHDGRCNYMSLGQMAPKRQIQAPQDKSKHPKDKSKPPKDKSKHAKDNSKHPTDKSEHPTDKSEHPTDKSEHPTDKSKRTQLTIPGTRSQKFLKNDKKMSFFYPPASKMRV